MHWRSYPGRCWTRTDWATLVKVGMRQNGKNRERSENLLSKWWVFQPSSRIFSQQREDSSLTKVASENDLGGPRTTIAGFCSVKPNSHNSPPSTFHTQLPSSIAAFLYGSWGLGTEPRVFCMLFVCQAMSSGSFGFCCWWWFFCCCFALFYFLFWDMISLSCQADLEFTL